MRGSSFGHKCGMISSCGVNQRVWFAPLDEINVIFITIIGIFSTYFPTNRQLVKFLIAPLSDIPMFYIKYLTMHRVHVYAGAIRQ